MMPSVHNQKGATLVVALLMLAVLALLGVNAVTNSTVNLRITNNIQAYQDVEAATQNAIEEVISDIDSFKSPQARTFNVDGFVVTTSAPICLDTRPAEGYSATAPMAPQETQWEVRATLTDAATGAQTVIRHGIGTEMLAGYCL